MKKRWLLALGVPLCAGVLGYVLVRWLESLRPEAAHTEPAVPWYFDEAQCEARLLNKTPHEVEEAIGRRPNYFGRPFREHPELDSSHWGPGIVARTAWHFDWGAITVEYGAGERSVFAEVWRYHPAAGEPDRIVVSR
jgi:hypothetical protein